MEGFGIPQHLHVSAASPLCARSAWCGTAWHRSAHLGIPDGTSILAETRTRGAAGMAGELCGDASDRWWLVRGDLSRITTPHPTPVTRNGPHGGRTGDK